MVKAPKVHYVRTPIIVGQGPGAIYAHDYQGLILSEGHYRLRAGGWSGGGPLYVLKQSLHYNNIRRASYWRNGTTWDGVTCGATGTPTFTLPVLSAAASQAALDEAAAYGLRGYNRTKPGQSSADLAVAAKELWSDGLPSLPLGSLLKGDLKHFPFKLKALLEAFRRLGGEYLNIVFGWKPFIRDLRRLYATMRTIDAQIAKLKAQNGQSIRRRAVLRDDVVTSTSGASYSTPFINVYGGPPSWPIGSTVYRLNTTTKTRVWYSACYRYWIPDVKSWGWDLRARAALFGVLPTPKVLYDAMPWSWLVDWFTDVGELVDAVSPTAVSGTTMKYGYTMLNDVVTSTATSHVTHSSAATRVGNFGSVWEGCDATFSTIYKKERKIRTGGVQPFGPGFSVGSLSAGQWAILAALGLSRSKLT